MRVAFDDQYAAAAIDGDARGRDDLRLRRNSLENEPRIKHFRRRDLGAHRPAASIDEHGNP